MKKKPVLQNLTAIVIVSTFNQVYAIDFSTAKQNVFDYNYAEAEFVDYDAGDSGFKLTGSFDLKSNAGIIGHFATASNYTELGFGGDYHAKFDVLPNADYLFYGGFERGEFSFDGIFADYTYDDSGFFFGGGVRSQLMEQLEVDGEISYHSFFDGDIRLTGRVLYKLGEHLDLKAQLDLEDNDRFSIGVRYYY